jgi:hypothetical protein
VPLQVTMGYPSADATDSHADAAQAVAGGGHWREGFSPEMQAHWAEAFAALALCKPAVRGVQWVHLLDSAPHQFPNCGLADADDVVKPALQRLRDLRRTHLR